MSEIAVGDRRNVMSFYILQNVKIYSLIENSGYRTYYNINSYYK